MRWSVALGGVVTACATASSPPIITTTPPATRGHDAPPPVAPPAPLTFVVDEPAVGHYNDPPPELALAPGDDALVTATRATADPWLFRAANQLAPLMDRPIDVDVVGFVFAWNAKLGDNAFTIITVVGKKTDNY